jgi:hypothetical protein
MSKISATLRFKHMELVRRKGKKHVLILFQGKGFPKSYDVHALGKQTVNGTSEFSSFNANANLLVRGNNVKPLWRCF